MKYIKSYILSVLMVFAVTGCSLNDLQDDVNDLKDRVTLIEQQVKLLNDNLAVVGYILDAQNKTVSRVETVTEGGKETQHVITLSDGTKLTLTIGAPGTVNEPVITVGEDKMWYINGVSTGKVAVGEPGKNGEGFPEFRVEKGNWEVRFGGGSWSLVPGGAGVANGSLGDQIFESATVSADGQNFVVTLKNGDVHTLPIVATLVCAIDRSGLTIDADGFLVMQYDERVIVPVKIKGNNPIVTYPQGWRANLNKLENVDEKGNNYQLLIYAPAAKQSLTRASADNASDVIVQVQEGSFWAVDKIKVKNPKEETSNGLDKYNNGETLKIGELEISKAVYGNATEITADGTISGAGVYFVSKNSVTLTYALPSTGVDNLIILPASSEVTTINLEVNSQIYFTGTVAFQGINFTNNVNNNYPLRVNATAANVTLDKCTINGLLATRGLVMPNTTNTHHLRNFAVTNSNIKIESNGNGLFLIHSMNASQVVFENNIVYYSGVVPEDTNFDGHLFNFKLYNGQNNTLEELRMSSNTFVDVESSGTSGTTGIVYGKEIKKVTMSSNIYWLTYPATIYPGDNKGATTTVFLRGVPATHTNASGANNYAYSGNSLMNIKTSFTGLPIGIAELDKVDDLFNITNPVTFNKTTGVFTPKDGYTQYGAQR